jgi:hypothetical protein
MSFAILVAFGYGPSCKFHVLPTSDGQGGMRAAHQDLFSARFLALPLRCSRLQSLDNSRAGTGRLSPAVDFRFHTVTSFSVQTWLFKV